MTKLLSALIQILKFHLENGHTYLEYIEETTREFEIKLPGRNH